jgi:hypothetical protein
MNEAEDRAEDLRVSEFALDRDAIENSGLHEIAGFVAGDLGVATVDENLGA